MARFIPLINAGVYVCAANNSLGARWVAIELVVRSPLETRVRPGEQTVDLGRPAAMACDVLGHPIKEISWYRNGEKVEAEGVNSGHR